MVLCLPFYAVIDIHKLFHQLYLDPTLSHPEQWTNVDFKGIPKTRETDKLDKLRWIAGINVFRQWYSRVWGKSLIPRSLPPYFRRVRTYGFTPGFAPDDVVDFVVEGIRKAARWNMKQLLVITLDIKTAFDAMKHNTIHASNKRLGPPP